MEHKTLKYINAFLLDAFLWFYTALVSYKILYQKYLLNLRRPDFYWFDVWVSLGAGALLALVFFFVKGFSVGRVSQGLYVDKGERPFYQKPHSLFLIWNVLLTFLAGILISQVSLSEFFSAGGLAGAGSIFGQLLNPNFGIFEKALFAAIETLYMAFMATTIAIPFAFIFSFFAAKNLMSGVLGNGLYGLTRFILNVTRSIEPLVWAIIFSVWVGIGPFAGMLALFLHSVASLAKLYSEQIENVSDGPIEAMKATGAAPVLVVWYGVVPQIVIPFLSFTIYRWDINVRMATIIGMVGGGGIGTILIQYQGQALWREVGLIVMVIAAIVWMLDYASAKIRAAIK